MGADQKMKKEEKALVRRYLVWCYKTTKESVDWIERKFTQTAVDRFVLARIEKMRSSTSSQDDYNKKVEDFRNYIADKEKDGIKQKFLNGKKKDLNPEYLYLKNRLTAVEDAIRQFLGPQELTRIHLLYEQEMTRRILESKEH
jgi:hypothetical protein